MHALLLAMTLLQPVAILRVTSVTATLKDGRVTVVAHGETNSGGWTDLALQPAKGRDGTLAYVFAGNPPAGMAMQMITPVEATTTTGRLKRPYPKRVRVLAQTNEMTATIAK
jgi:hypothetical protein